MQSRNQDLEVTIIINGRPIAEYPHEGDTFVEGRSGSQYEVEIRNRLLTRVLAVLSIDGLSVMDGKPATHQSRGYVLNPYATIRVPGWRLTGEQVAAFAFGAVPASYSAQMGQGSANLGVIGVRTYAEQAIPPLTQRYAALGWPCHGINGAPIWVGGPAVVTGQNLGSMPDQPVGAVYGAARSLNASASASASTNAATTNAAPAVAQSLGTAFGAAQSFATTATEFRRGVELTTLLIYYDSAAGLTRRGIVLTKPKPVKPRAFADEGCLPPPHWQG